MKRSGLKRHTPMKRTARKWKPMLGVESAPLRDGLTATQPVVESTGKQTAPTPSKPRTPMKRGNAKRKARLFARNFHSPAFVRLVKYSGACQTCGHVSREEAPCECSHAEPRGMGGCGADWTRIFRQCPKCHHAYGHDRDGFLAERGLTWDHIEGFIAAIQSEWHNNERAKE